MKDYNFKEIEKKWQESWEKDGIFKVSIDEKKEKFYCLEMFPYPSGALHMGHVRNYSIGDVLARYYIMNGKNVLHPIGWDAFGLPAENAAIKNKIHPAKWTRQNIEVMRKQLKTLGFSYDWDREIAACDENYYKWNQWFFIKMHERGLVFRKTASVNWCSTCNTVLANEQVSEGVCWRCGNVTEQRDLKQWFIKITDYSDELLQRHDRLSNGHWPEQVLSMQRNWIGKSEGAEVDFDIAQTDKKLKVFTTRPDTLFGATFMAIAPEHAIINELQSKIKNWEEISKYIKASAAKTNIERAQNKEKTGVEIKGVKAINPLTKKEIPIFTADYVLTGYGTGAIMAVPAHDQRDWDFAKKFNLEIIEVIKGENSDIKNAAFEEEGVLINSGHFNGLKSTEAVKIVSDWIEKEKLGQKTINFKFKDWLISRQRYWGTPVPMIHCPKCGIVPVNFEDLPVKLPENIEFTGIGDSPLKSSAEFLNVKCPKCGGGAKRDADTMDTFIDSSWYYARYCDPKNDKEPFDFKSNYWLPVDQYIGGIEHACMHLMYARFWHKIMRDLGLVKSDEPFTNLLTQGMVTLGGSAMSKSRGNTVSPDAMIEKYGADAVRLFILFAAPPQKQLEWSLEGIEGAWRFVNRVWRLQEIVGVFDNNAEISDGGKNADSQEKENLIKTMHKTIKKTAEDIEKKFQFNTAISAIMELVNLLYLYTNHQKDGGVSKEVYKTVILLLSPFTPHLCEEIWRNLGEKNYISLADFPKFDAALIKDEIVEIPVQINGKIRSRVSVSADASEEEVRKTMESDEKTAKNLAGREVIKFIYVKNKIASFTIE